MAKFSWGKVIDKFVYDFDGEIFEVVKYYPYEFKKGTSTGKIDYDTIKYHNEEISRSSSNLKMLVLYWFTYKNLGINHSALAVGIGRALKIYEE